MAASVWLGTTKQSPLDLHETQAIFKMAQNKHRPHYGLQRFIETCCDVMFI